MLTRVSKIIYFNRIRYMSPRLLSEKQYTGIHAWFFAEVGFNVFG